MLARLVAIADGTGGVPSPARRGSGTITGRWRWSRRWAPIRRPTASPGSDSRPTGPIALLPEGDHYGLVWTTSPERAKSRLAQDDAGFSRISRTNLDRARRAFTSVADRRTFPLVLEFAWTTAGARCVVLGNAAQTLHPVAGQGFNVGLRDAYGLALAILDSPRDEIGSTRDARSLCGLPAGSTGWRASRSRTGWSRFSAAIARCFAGRAGWRSLCSTRFPPVKRAFTRAMMFGVCADATAHRRGAPTSFARFVPIALARRSVRSTSHNGIAARPRQSGYNLLPRSFSISREI